jgi:hypothetical protein
MTTLVRFAFASALLASAASPAAAGDLKLTISNGRVTIEAKDVTVREILAEWARVGQTVIVNGDKITGPPVTLQLTDVPEAQALDSLLRAAAGYVMAPRAVGTNGPSVYDRIMILASSRPPTSTASSMSAAPPVSRPFPQLQMGGSPDDDQEVGPGGNANIFMNGSNNAMMPGPTGMPQAAPAQPQGPLTASRPGMLPAPPAAPVAAPGVINQNPANNPNSPFNPTPTSPYQGAQPGVTPVYTPMPTPPATRPGNPATTTGRGGGG